jgi:transcriptional regulator with XRE-family HTH domain
MATFTAQSRRGYPPVPVTLPAKAPGPWGEAIDYWLKQKNMRQADLVRASGIDPNTISSIVRGFNTTTRLLWMIAKALQVPIDEVLLSPTRRTGSEAQKRMIAEAVELALNAHNHQTAEQLQTMLAEKFLQMRNAEAEKDQESKKTHPRRRKTDRKDDHKKRGRK